MSNENTHRSSRRGSTGLLMVDLVTYVLTGLLSGLLLLAYLAPYVSPNVLIWFALLGLAAPFLYIANALMMLYWAMRWKAIAWLCVLAALLGAGHVGKYFRPQLSRSYVQVRPEGAIRVMSYNVGGFLGVRQGRVVSQMNEITSYIREQDPDIVCLQEYEVNHINTKATFDRALADLNYNAVSYTLDQHNGSGWGLAIYSKYRILSRESILFPESTNSAMWVDLLVRRDTVRVFNNHLQSTQINEADRTFLGSEVLSDTLRNEKSKDIVRKLMRNFRVRASQVDSVARFIHDGTPRVIVCGDFNDTPLSYAYNSMRGNLVDAFTRKGSGMVYTYKGLLGLFRIDYIFHSSDFETAGYNAELPVWSDHNPVIVDLKLTK